MFTRLLIPLDGSITAEQVLPYARSLARTLSLPIELLAVLDVRGFLTSQDKARALDGLLREETHKIENYLASVAKRLPGTKVGCSVEQGSAAEVIIEKAAGDKSTLVAMTTHGRSGLKRWLLGSVAEKVLRATENPLLLVRATTAGQTDGEATLRSIVIPLDGSELAEQAVPVLAEIAKKLAAEVFLFRAYQNPYGPFSGGAGPYNVNLDALMAEVREETRGYLEHKVTQLKRQGVNQISCLLQEGNAADEIVATAKKIPESLIAMCSHGRSGLTRWALGSVTETVVRHTHNPVLVLRAK